MPIPTRATRSGYSAHDFVSLGFLTSPKHAPLLDATAALSGINPADHAAIIVAGGQAPMFTFRENAALQGLTRAVRSASARAKLKTDVAHILAGERIALRPDAYRDHVRQIEGLAPHRHTL